MNRRSFLLSIAALPTLSLPFAGLSLSGLSRAAHASANGPTVEVMKSPSCGCCSAWADHLLGAGFQVELRDLSDDALWQMKDRLGVPEPLASCHTARVEGYVIEGHVPAADITRLLQERPNAKGLTVPGMPLGSPGMEMGQMRDRFDTLLLRHDGRSTVFAQHG
ncbi:DUF411 domain-containing protein [Phaeobacter sp.]|uniref:DUF411 domain-containing protein n=1 Tax=Phaeobacter sp. TaxID=1902409 RepID=UPI0025F32BED|nr:DUF411 domain-containing protein [Phaeobacter sp.]